MTEPIKRGIQPIKRQRVEVKPAQTVTEVISGSMDINIKGKAGRKAKRPPSKLKAFHLPLDIIDRIEAQAEEELGGNASALLIDILLGKRRLHSE